MDGAIQQWSRRAPSLRIRKVGAARLLEGGRRKFRGQDDEQQANADAEANAGAKAGAEAIALAKE